MKLYAYNGVGGKDAHELVIELSGETAMQLGIFQQNERPRPKNYEVGQWFELTDEEGKRWRVASAPCGLGCHCAAVAEPV